MTIADTAWWLDGTSLNTLAYYVREIDESTPTRRGDNQAKPGVSGSRFVAGKPFDERVLALMMVIDAQPTGGGARSGAQLKANLDVIKMLFSRDGQHTLKRTHGGVDRQLTVEVRSLRIARGGPYHYNVAAELVAADPFWYALTGVSFSATWNSPPLLPGGMNVVNNGTYKVEKALLTIEGPVTNPKVAVGASWVQWTGTLQTNDKCLINCDTLDAVIDLITAEPISDVQNVTWAEDFVRWLEIPVGSSEAYLSGADAVANTTKLKIEFYEAYL